MQTHSWLVHAQKGMKDVVVYTPLQDDTHSIPTKVQTSFAAATAILTDSNPLVTRACDSRAQTFRRFRFDCIPAAEF
jgi:hypothetical protein